MNEEVLEKPRLEVGPPKPLPIGGITRQQFDAWKDQLVTFLNLQVKLLITFIIVKICYRFLY